MPKPLNNAIGPLKDVYIVAKIKASYVTLLSGCSVP